MARAVDSYVDFIEKMLFSEPSWLSYDPESDMAEEWDQLDNGIIKQMIFTQPYYRKALQKIRTEVEELRAITRSKRSGAKPKPSILRCHRGISSHRALGWPNRRKVLVEWFGASLNDPEVLEKVKEIDEQLSSIKADAYVQYYINDMQGIDNYTYLTSQWQPSEEEEEEHKFYKFLCTNFFDKDFLRDKPYEHFFGVPGLKVLEVFTRSRRPPMRAKARNLYLRMRETLNEALTGEPEDYERLDTRKLDGVRFFFGRTLNHGDVFAKAEEYAEETKALFAKAERQIYNRTYGHYRTRNDSLGS